MKSNQKLLAVFVIGSSLAGASAFAAHPAPPAGVPAQSRSEVREQRVELRDERMDLRELQDLQDRFERARARGNYSAMAKIELDLRRLLDAELRDARGEVREARADARFGGKRERAEVRDASKDRQRLASIDRELSKLRGRFDRVSIAKKRALVSELVQLARAEVREQRAARFVARR